MKSVKHKFGEVIVDKMWQNMQNNLEKRWRVLRRFEKLFVSLKRF